MGASIRAGLTLGRSAAVLGLGIIGQYLRRIFLETKGRPTYIIDSLGQKELPEAKRHIAA